MAMSTFASEAPKRVLVVDDDADIRESMRDALSEVGYAVDIAANGLEALRHLRSSASLPEVILLDLMMPVMNGIEFYLAKARDPQIASIPVVVVTASSNALARVQPLAPLGVLQKPIELDELFAILERLTRGGAVASRA